MEKIRNVISVFLIAVILLYGAVVVSADETPNDWANVDWEDFNDQGLEPSQWQSLRDWLHTEADLHTVFYVTTTTGDGWVGELWSRLVYSLFIEDPVPFIQALALEDEMTQSRTISYITFEADGARDEFQQFMSELVLPDTASAGDRSILARIISHAEENQNMDITNPQTGDPIGFASLLMVASGLGVSLLLKRRKQPIE